MLGRVFFVGGMEDVAKRDQFVSSILFTNWIRSLSEKITIQSVIIASIDYKPNGDVIFAKLSVKAFNGPNHEIRPNVVFLRGGSVAVLPLLVSLETNQKYIIFTKQVRLPVGEVELVEIPAGMLDGDNNFAGVAAKEIQEETGIIIAPDDLTPLTPDVAIPELGPLSFPRAIAVSPGACDETMRFYLFTKIMPQADIDALTGKLTGNKEEGESICLWIVPFEQAAQVTRDGKFFTAYALARLQGYF